MDTKLWVALGCVSVLGTIVGYVGKYGVEYLGEKLDKIAQLLQELQISRATHTQDIRILQERMEDHEDRLRSVEYKNISERL